MKIKPVNRRILATIPEVAKSDPNAVVSPGTNAELDKYMVVKVVSSSVDEYKKGTHLAVPSYVDRLNDKTKEYVIFHESDVVAVVEEK